MNEDWKVSLVSVTDGDTVRVHMERELPLMEGWGHTVRSLQTKGVPVRLIILDTPERGRPGWASARADLATWFEEYRDRIRVETYGSGGFDRILGDFYVEGERGNTASQFMLLKEWSPYLS